MCSGGPKPGGSPASSSVNWPSVSNSLALTDIVNPPRSIRRPSPGRNTKPPVGPVAMPPPRSDPGYPHARVGLIDAVDLQQLHRELLEVVGVGQPAAVQAAHVLALPHEVQPLPLRSRLAPAGAHVALH